MSQFKTKDRFGAELRRFAENIDIHQFKPLSHGIGIGQINQMDGQKAFSSAFSETKPASHYTTLQPQGQKLNLEIDAQSASLSLRRLFPSQQVIETNTDVNLRRYTSYDATEAVNRTNAGSDYPSAARRKPGVILRMFKFALGHGIDLVVVFLSLTTAIIAGGLILAPNAHSLAARIVGWTPVAELMRLNLVEVLGGFYVLFILYWIFFKLVVGVTVGQSIFRRADRPSKPKTESLADEPN